MVLWNLTGQGRRQIKNHQPFHGMVFHKANLSLMTNNWLWILFGIWYFFEIRDVPCDQKNMDKVIEMVL
jgi:hypothetical protein